MIAQQADDLILVLNSLKSLEANISAAGSQITECLRRGNKVLTAGNGGSASDALHLAEELMGKFEQDRAPLAAISLNSDPTLLTCIGNDYGFSSIFSRQVRGLGKPGDVLIVFTTSGNSVNINQALKECKLVGVISIALLGKAGGISKGLADFSIIVPSTTTARIQEAHTLILHSWISQIEEHLFEFSS